MLPISQHPQLPGQKFSKAPSASGPPRQSTQAGTRNCWEPKVEAENDLLYELWDSSAPKSLE